MVLALNLTNGATLVVIYSRQMKSLFCLCFTVKITRTGHQLSSVCGVGAHTPRP